MSTTISSSTTSASSSAVVAAATAASTALVEAGPSGAPPHPQGDDDDDADPLLQFFLTPSVPPERAASFRSLVAQHTHIAFLSDSEDGSLCILSTFEGQELRELQERGRCILGLPLAERLLTDPSAIGQIKNLPLFDLILPQNFRAVCLSGLVPAKRTHCAKLLRWMGGQVTEDAVSEAALLVTSRVSLHPESKYQAAVQRRIPIVRPEFLEAIWEAKREVPLSSYRLSALAGLSICFGSIQAQSEDSDRLRAEAIAAGALDVKLDKAEIVIANDIFSSWYLSAQESGHLTAPPKWVRHCIQVNLAVPVAGDLEVQRPKALELLGGVSKDGKEPESMHILAGCVLCLLYLPAGETRDAAKAAAWKLGAYTTLDPKDRAITHVVFKVNRLTKEIVKVSISTSDERASFVDVSWLDACLTEKRRLPTAAFPTPRVAYDPVGDTLHQALRRGSAPPQRPVTLRRRASGVNALPSAESLPALTGGTMQQATPSSSSGAVPKASDVQRWEPLALQGPFVGMKIGLLDWPQNEAGTEEMAHRLRGHGATVIIGSPEALVVSDAGILLCRGFQKPDIVRKRPASAISAEVATLRWAEACMSEGVNHPVRSSVHFRPTSGLLPLQEMARFKVRVTALGPSNNLKRRRLEELVQALGAEVAQQSTKWSDITHVVCLMHIHLDKRVFEAAKRRRIPLVGVQWLSDCYTSSTCVSISKYAITRLAEVPTSTALVKAQPAQDLTAKRLDAQVLREYHLFISHAVLGSNPRRQSMAEELGGEAKPWSTVHQLIDLLTQSRVPVGDHKTNDQKVAIIVEKEECAPSSELTLALASRTRVEQRTAFVHSAWLEETYQQRRVMPLENFLAFPISDSEGPEAKRARLGAEEAQFSWQNKAQQELQALAEDSRQRALQAECNQKVSEGLKLALNNRSDSDPARE